MEADAETAERIAKLESAIKHLKDDFERHRDNDFREVRSIALSVQNRFGWCMGAAAGAGAMLPLVLPKIVKAMGLS